MRKIFALPPCGPPPPPPWEVPGCRTKYFKALQMAWRVPSMSAETAKSDEKGDLGENDDVKARNFLPRTEKANSGRSRVPEWLESNREMYLHFEIMGRGMHKVRLSFWDCPLADSCRVLTLRCPEAACNCSISNPQCTRRLPTEKASLLGHAGSPGHVDMRTRRDRLLACSHDLFQGRRG